MGSDVMQSKERTVRRKHGAEASPPAKPRREYLRADERRSRILDAARDVFTRVGLGGARTRELAKAAGINEATMFSHFANKEELFLAAVIEPLQEGMKNARARGIAFQEAPTTKARDAVGREAARRIFESAEELYPMLAVGLFAEREAGRRLYCDHVYPMLRERGEEMQASLREGIDGEFLSIAIFGIALAVSADHLFRNVSPDIDDLAEKMTDLLQYGCAPKKKKK